MENLKRSWKKSWKSCEECEPCHTLHSLLNFSFQSHLQCIADPFHTYTPPTSSTSAMLSSHYFFHFHSFLLTTHPTQPTPIVFSLYLSLSLSSTADKAKLSLKDVGLQDCDFKTGELWGFAGYKKSDEGVAVGFLQGFDIVELDTELNLGWNFKTCSKQFK